MITGQIYVDDREFKAALRDLIAQSSRTMARVVNGTAVSVASRAIRNTKVGSTDKIRAELGQTATILRFRGGRLVRGKAGGVMARKGRSSILLPGETFIHAGEGTSDLIKRYHARMTASGKRFTAPTVRINPRSGERGFRVKRSGHTIGSREITIAHKLAFKKVWMFARTREEFNNVADYYGGINEMARRFIANRVARVGYVRSGWHGALDNLWHTVRAMDRTQAQGLRVWKRKDVWQHKRPRGMAKPAVPNTRNPFAEIQSMSLGQKDNQQYADPQKIQIATEGLRAGLREATLDMRRHMEEKFSELLRKHSAR